MERIDDELFDTPPPEQSRREAVGLGIRASTTSGPSYSTHVGGIPDVETHDG